MEGWKGAPLFPHSFPADVAWCSEQQQSLMSLPLSPSISLPLDLFVSPSSVSLDVLPSLYHPSVIPLSSLCLLITSSLPLLHFISEFYFPSSSLPFSPSIPSSPPSPLPPPPSIPGSLSKGGARLLCVSGSGDHFLVSLRPKSRTETRRPGPTSSQECPL